MEGLAKIGVDISSLIFYLLNFGVIVFILAKFIYKPLIKYLDERRKVIESNLRESENLREEFTKQIREQRAGHEQEERELKKKMEAIWEQSEKRNKEFIKQAEAERDRMLEETKRQMDVVRMEWESKVEKELLEKVEMIVENAVKQGLTGEEATRYITRAWKDIRNS